MKTKKDIMKLGEYIYMGMGKCLEQTVVLSVAYNMDYCIKKALQFESLTPHVKFYKINKVKTGDLVAECSYDIEGNLIIT